MSIRYLAIELLCISLGIADPAKEKWTERYLGGPDTPNIAPWEGTTIDYGVLPVLERERIYDANQKIKNRDYFGKPSERKFSSQDLGQYTMDICGVLVPRFGTNASLPSKLVMTENTKTNLRNIAMTIVAEKPLLLQSVLGAGKSFLIDEIGKLFGRFEGISHPDCS
jgi:midasin (ATPase involved in ribosome maturation)